MGAPALTGIVNPVAGGGRARALLAALPRTVAVALTHTRGSGDAARWARRHRRAPVVVVIGGDGTLHEVLNELDLARQAVVLIPGGTGNNIGRALGMPGAEQMLAAVARGGPRRVDLLRVTLRLADGRTRRRVTASTLAVGWPVETVRLANRRLKLLGRFCYPVAAGLAAALARPFSSSLRVGRARARRLPMRGLLVNNTRHAGNFEAFPRAALADGRADGMIMTAGPVSQSLHNLSVLAGSDVWDPSARFRASAVDLRLDRPAGVQLDGELYGGVARLAIRVERGGWRLYAPPGCRL